MSSSFETVYAGLERVRDSLVSIRSAGRSAGGDLEAVFQHLHDKSRGLGRGVDSIVSGLRNAHTASTAQIADMSKHAAVLTRNVAALTAAQNLAMWANRNNPTQATANALAQAQIRLRLEKQAQDVFETELEYAQALNVQESQKIALIAHESHILKERDLAVRRVASEISSGFAAKTVFGAVTWVRSANTALIEANSSLKVRNQLSGQALALAARYGTSLDSSLGVYTALTRLGYDNIGIHNTTAATIIKMKIGLGASVDESVKLLATTSAIGADYAKIADTIARVVDGTSLAADEVSRLAQGMSKTAILTGQSGNNMSAGLAQISVMAGKLKQYGLDPDKVMDFYRRASMPEGAALSMYHGGGYMNALEGNNPDVLMRGLIARAKSFGTGPMGATARLSVAQALGVDPEFYAMLAVKGDEINAALDREAALAGKGDELMTRYLEQRSRAVDGIDQLSTSLANLRIYALTPVMNMVGTVSTWLTTVVDKVASVLSGKIFERDGKVGKMGIVLAEMFQAGFTSAVAYMLGKAFLAVGKAAIGVYRGMITLATSASRVQVSLDALSLSIANLGRQASISSASTAAARTTAATGSAVGGLVRGSRWAGLGKGILITSVLEMLSIGLGQVQGSGLASTIGTVAGGAAMVNTVAMMFNKNLFSMLGSIAGKASGLMRGANLSSFMSTALKFSKFAGPVGLAIAAATTIWSGVQGWKSAGARFGTLDATWAQRSMNALSSALSTLTFGVIDIKTDFEVHAQALSARVAQAVSGMRQAMDAAFRNGPVAYFNTFRDSAVETRAQILSLLQAEQASGQNRGAHALVNQYFANLNQATAALDTGVERAFASLKARMSPGRYGRDALSVLSNEVMRTLQDGSETDKARLINMIRAGDDESVIQYRHGTGTQGSRPADDLLTSRDRDMTVLTRAIKELGDKFTAAINSGTDRHIGAAKAQETARKASMSYERIFNNETQAYGSV